MNGSRWKRGKKKNLLLAVAELRGALFHVGVAERRELHLGRAHFGHFRLEEEGGGIFQGCNLPILFFHFFLPNAILLVT